MQEDLAELGITDTFEQIESYSKYAWKTKVKKIIKEQAFIYLIDQVKERNMTKIINNKYSELKIQDYLNSSEVSRNVKKFIFKLRSKMIDVSANFGKKEVCPICKTDENNQLHLLDCEGLDLDLDISGQITDKNTMYNNIYEEDSDVVIEVSRLLYKAYQKRDIILDQTRTDI